LKLAPAVEKRAKQLVPNVKTALMDYTPNIGVCQVFLGCYLKSQRDVVVHLNQVRGLPKDQTTYIKIKVTPDPDKSTKNIYAVDDKMEIMHFDKYIQVRKNNNDQML